MNDGASFRNWLLLLYFLSCVPPSAIAQSVTVSPSTFSFGNQTVGAASAAQKIILKNGQNTAVTIGSISSSLSDYTQTNNCPASPATLGASKTCTISVTFTPKVLGARTGTLTVVDSGLSSPQTISLSGTGVTAVTVSPSGLSFGSQPLALKSAASNVTVTNNQSVALTITNISTNLSDYSLSTTCPTPPSTLATKAHCSVSVFFTPSALGVRSATLSIRDSANANPTVSLTGSGIIAAIASPGSLTFPAQALGSTSATQTVVLTNNQSTTLAITSVTSSLADFGVTSTCPISPATLAAGGKCTASVTFSPKATGPRNGTLSFKDRANNSPQTASLSGTGAAAALVSIAIAPATASVAIGKTQQFTATGTYTDGSKKALTSSVIWTSSLPNIATVGSAGLATAIAAGATNLSATAGAIQGSASLTVPVPTLVSISVTPSNPAIPSGTGQQFTATGTFSDGSKRDLSSQVGWSSSSTAIAGVNASGMATGANAGSATITATLGAISGSTALTVGPPALVSLALSPANPSFALGTRQALKAIGTYTDGSTRDLTSSSTWTTANSGIATVTSQGFAASVAVGGTTVTATVAPIMGSTGLTVTPPTLVSIAVTPGSSSIPAGTSQQFQATGTYTDNSTQDLTSSVTWSSSAPGIANLNSTGEATGTGVGVSNIVASLNSISGAAVLSVAQPLLVSITVSPANPSFALGTTQPLVATGTYTDGSTQDLTGTVTWTTTDSNIAYVTNPAIATSVAVGTTSVTAASGSVSGSTILTVTPAVLTSIAITPAIPSIPLGTTQQFMATGTFTNGSVQDVTQTVQWSSDALSVAAISNATGQVGLASSAGTGAATITASSGSVRANTTLTVTGAVLVSIAVTPASPAIALGTTQQFTATGTFTDGSTQDLSATATWSSDSPAIARTTNTGLAATVAVGTANITASSGNVTGSSGLIVTPAQLVSITVTPPSAVVPLGVTQGFAATGTYTDGTTQDITQTGHWSSTNASVATISNSQPLPGLAATFGIGSTTIQINSGAISASASLTVNPAALASIQINPQASLLALGTNQQFTATGTYTDGTTEDITTIVNWTSSSPAVLVISNATGSAGFGSSSGEGTATIAASSGAISSSTQVTVGQPNLVSIVVAPAAASLALGYTQQFTATATYTDGSTQDVTQSATWTSSVPSLASISAAGIASALSVGTTVISAASGSVSGSAVLTINPAVPFYLAITPGSPSLYVGSQQPFTATLQYSDGTLVNVTNTVSWSSSAPAVAVIANNGLASASGAGSAAIEATWGTSFLTATTTLTVMLPVVTITPANALVPMKGTQQFSVTVTGSSNQGVTWSVDGIAGGNSSVGTLSASGSYLSPLTIGTHTIGATALADTASLGNATVKVGTVEPVASSFFGMHVNSSSSAIPATVVGTARVWDSKGAQWPDINTSNGVFTWTGLDNLLAAFNTAGIQDVLYTLWRVPQWASSNPTDTACAYAKQGPGSTGECDLPGDLNADGTGANLIWRTWVQNIAQHVNSPAYLAGHAKISYWEPCNECYHSPTLDPGYDASGGEPISFRGTYAQLLRMMQDVRCIILGNPNDPITALNTTCGEASYPVIGVDPTAKMVMPSTAPGQSAKNPPYAQVMQNFLYCTCSGNSCSASSTGCTTGSAGSAAVDILSVHIEGGNQPEQIPNQMATIRSYLSGTDLNKQMWLSEGGWGQSTISAPINDGDPDLEAAWLGRFFVMSWATGLARDYWYEWDNASYGTLWSPSSVSGCTTPFTSGYICSGGIAYQQVHTWLLGATLTNCSASATSWVCSVTLANGSPAQILWDTSQTCSGGVCSTIPYPVSPVFTQYTDLTGASSPVSGTVAVGLKPILLTTQ